MFARQYAQHQKYILLALVLLAIVTLTGALATPVWALTSPLSDDTATPILVQLKMDKLPTLGQTATLSCVAKTARLAPDTTVELVLPAGAQLVGGTGRWSGSIMPGSPVTMNATVRFSQLGKTEISCRASAQIDARNRWGDTGTLYLTLGKELSQAGFARQPHGDGIYGGGGQGQPVMSGMDEPEVEADVNAQADVPALDPTLGPQAQVAPETPAGYLTVTGRWMYYDRYGTYVPAKKFIVQLYNATTGASLKYCYTDTNGYYSCGPVLNPGAQGFRTRIYSYVKYSPYLDVLRVTDGTGVAWSDTYAFRTSKYQNVPNGTYDVGTWYVPDDNVNERAYWLKDDLDRAWNFVWTNAGSNEVPKETAGGATIYWYETSTDGTHYHTGGKINLKGADPLSHDTAIHEYAHAIMYKHYGNWFPPTYCPSPHYVNLVSHENCAWTEGWADYFPLAVNNDPVYHWANGDYLDIDAPTWGSAYWDAGETVEGRVAGALWDLVDTGIDGTDSYSESFDHVWQVFYHQNDNKFKEYWNAWLTRGHNYPDAVMSVYQNTIDFRAPDVPGVVSPAAGADLYNHSITLDWTAPARATKYKIQVRQGSTTGTLIVNTTIASSLYTKTYTSHAHYWWRVAACNTWFGCSPFTDWTEFHLNP